MAVLASSLLDSPPGQKLILEPVTNPGNKWIKSPRVVEAITRASYTLDVDYILDTVFPLLEDASVRKEVNMRHPAEALAYAIARDISKEEVPTYTSKEIPFFGF